MPFSQQLVFLDADHCAKKYVSVEYCCESLMRQNLLGADKPLLGFNVSRARIQPGLDLRDRAQQIQIDAVGRGGLLKAIAASARRGGA